MAGLFGIIGWFWDVGFRTERSKSELRVFYDRRLVWDVGFVVGRSDLLGWLEPGGGDWEFTQFCSLRHRSEMMTRRNAQIRFSMTFIMIC